MSNYTKTTDFAEKDSLPTGDARKIIRGAEFGTEFDNIATAIATKADTAGPTLTGTTTFDTLSDGTIAVTAFVDEDDMSSDSATMLPTQQSVKAYVDSQTTAQDLDFEADTGGPLSIDLDSETLTLTGGTGVDTSGAGNAVTFAIDSTVATLTDTQTLTNKTLTSPTLTGTTLTGTTLLADLIVNDRQVATDDASGVNIDGNDVTVRGGASTGTGAGGNLIFQTTPAAAAGNIVNTFSTIMTLDESGIDVAGAVEFDSLSGTGAVSVTDVLDEDDMTSDSATALATQQSIKAYVDSQVGANNELSEVLATGNTTGGTDIAVGTGDDITFADSSKAIFGDDSDLQIYHNGSNSYIDDAGTGSLVIRSSAVNIGKYTGETAAVFTADGSVQLRYDNSAKFETTNTGIDVTGVITTDGMTTSADINFGDNNKAIFGAGSDLQIYHDGTRSYISDSGTGDLRLQASEVRMVNAANTEVGFKFVEDGAASLYFNANEKLATTGSGIDVTGSISADGLTASGSGAVGSFDRTDANAIIELKRSGSLQGYIGASTGGDIILYNASAAQKLRAADNGDISFYEDTGTTAKFFWAASAETLAIGVSTANARLEVGAFATTSSDIAYFSNSNGSHKGIIRLDAQGDGEFVLRDAGNNEDVVITAGGDSYFNGGNVGIGTDSPSETLHVNAGTNNDVATFESTDANAKVNFKDNTSTSAINTNNGAMVINCDANDEVADSYMAFRVDNDEKMQLDSSGNLQLSGSTDNIIRSGSNSSRIRIFGGSSESIANGAALTLQGVSHSGGNFVDLASASGGYINFRNGSSDAMRIDSSGNVGIGTDLPSGALHVSRSGLEAGITLERTTSATAKFTMAANDGNLVFTDQNQSAERMRIDSSGNVGIGVTPSFKFHVKDTFSALAFEHSGGNAVLKIDGGNGDLSGSDFSSITDIGGTLLFGTNGGSEAMRIDSSAQVGIGTDAPERLLHVNSAGVQIGALIESTSTVSSRLSLMDANTTNSARVGIGATGDTLGLYAGGSSRVTVDDSGNVGIGTDSPDELLHLSDTGGNAVLKFTRNDTTTTSGSSVGTIQFAHSDADDPGVAATIVGKATNAFGKVALLFSTGNPTTKTERMRLDADGNLIVGTTSTADSAPFSVFSTGTAASFRTSPTTTVNLVTFRNGNGLIGNISTSGSTTTFNTSSDQRLKDNIVDAPSASDDIDAIQVRSFDWKADGSHQKYGMVAQELNTVAPEAVSEGATEEDMMGVDYSKLVPMMLKEIQSLRARVAQLETN